MTKPTRARRIPRKNKRYERQSMSALAPHQHELEAESAVHHWGEPLHDQSSQRQAQQLHGLHLPSVQRQAVAMEIARTQGNRSLNSLIHPAPDHVPPMLNDAVQRQQALAKAGAHPGGRGPGKIRNGTEQPYAVTGATLAQVVPQLAKFEGFAAQAYTAISIQGQVKPTLRKDGKYQACVQWIIAETTVDLPRWTDYDAACPAAQHEWDRFMRQARQHEQVAHVDAAHNLMKNLPAADKVIVGSDVDEVQANLQAKQVELVDRLKTLHDGCDHGVAIDALLHPEQGSC